MSKDALLPQQAAAHFHTQPVILVSAFFERGIRQRLRQTERDRICVTGFPHAQLLDDQIIIDAVRRFFAAEPITTEQERVKTLEREVKGLRRANEILRSASAFRPGGTRPPLEIV